MPPHRFPIAKRGKTQAAEELKATIAAGQKPLEAAANHTNRGATGT